jgi:hypothetical protein
MKKFTLMVAALALALSLQAVSARAEIRSMEMSIFGMD